MRIRAVLALLLLALPAAAQVGGEGWGQPGGGPLRTGSAPLGTLDVLAVGNGTKEGSGILGAWSTPHGVVLLTSAGGACRLAVVDAALHATPRGDGFACGADARPLAYAQRQDVLLVCLPGDVSQAGASGASPRPLVTAYRVADGREAWSLATGIAAAGPSSGANGAWGCAWPLLDEDRDLLVVPYSDSYGMNRVVGYRLSTHEEAWGVVVRAADYANGLGLPGVPVPAPPIPATPTDPLAGDFLAVAATETLGGIVLQGAAQAGADAGGVASGALVSPAVAWVSFEGVLLGAANLGLDPGGARQGQTQLEGQGARYPAAQSTYAATILGYNQIVLVDGQGGIREQGTVDETAAPQVNGAAYPPPVFSRDTVLVPGSTQAYLFGATTLQQTRGKWTGYLHEPLVDALMSNDGNAYVLAQAASSSVRQGGNPDFETAAHDDLLRVSTLDASSIQRIPVPLPRLGAGSSGLAAASARLLPLGTGRVLAWDRLGDLTLLGPAPTALQPRLALDNDAPPVEEAVRVAASRGPEAPALRRVLVGWDDNGNLGSYPPGTDLNWTYFQGSDKHIRVTFVYADNRTGSSEVVAHVGSPPQPPPNLFEVLFSPQNQNWTFFFIGLFVTLLGFVVTAMGVFRGRRRIDLLLRELESIREDGRREAFAAVRALHEFREARRADLGKGKLADAQYTVLEAHADRILELLRQRILGAFVGRVSDRFSHALDLALADGTFDAAEADGLEALVAEEKALSAEERKHLRGLVQSWSGA